MCVLVLLYFDHVYQSEYMLTFFFMFVHYPMLKAIIHVYTT